MCPTQERRFEFERPLFNTHRFIKCLCCLLEPVGQVLGKFVFTFEVNATAVSVVLFVLWVPGRKKGSSPSMAVLFSPCLLSK